MRETVIQPLIRGPLVQVVPFDLTSRHVKGYAVVPRFRLREDTAFRVSGTIVFPERLEVFVRSVEPDKPCFRIAFRSPQIREGKILDKLVKKYTK